MRVVVHQVHAHVARPGDPEDGVHVGAVQVQQGTPLVQEPGDRADLRIEQSERVGVGHHEDRRLVAQLGAEVVQVDEPPGIALDGHGLEAGEMRRGRIGAVGAVGDQDLRPPLAPVSEVGRRHQERGQLALGARRRLEAHGVQPGDLAEHLLELEEELQQALQSHLFLVRMLRGETRQRRQPLVPLRVVLHRAGAERVEIGVDRHVERRQVRVVADNVQLAQLRQRRSGVADQVRRGDQRRERLIGDVGLRQDRGGPSGTAGFEEQRGLVELVHQSSRFRFMRRSRPRGSGSRGSRRRHRSPHLPGA